MMYIRRVLESSDFAFGFVFSLYRFLGSSCDVGALIGSGFRNRSRIGRD